MEDLEGGLKFGTQPSVEVKSWEIQHLTHYRAVQQKEMSKINRFVLDHCHFAKVFGFNADFKKNP